MKLQVVNAEAEKPALLLIHGWGMSSIVWQDWLPPLQQKFSVSLLDLPGYGFNADVPASSLEDCLAQCAKAITQPVICIGYSLGGMIALQLSEQYPEKFRAVITLASNSRFVQGEDYAAAMDAETFANFYQQAATNPQSILKRFVGLQVNNDKALLKKLRGKLEDLESHTLTTSLNWLQTIDNCERVKQLNIPVLGIFASDDQLVPVEAVKLLPGTMRTEVIESSPHSVFVSHAEQCWQAIDHFLQDRHLIASKAALDKTAIARSFSRAASTYDSVADLQRRVGHRLLEKAAATTAETVLDLGCGTGFFSEALQATFADSQLIGLDLAEGMTRYAASHHKGMWLCGDAEQLPLADNSIDVIFSSLAIQWCENNAQLFSELFRVLKPGGQLLVATLGPDTLKELRRAWQAVDDYVHVNRFVSEGDLTSSMQQAGFLSPHIAEEIFTLEYARLTDLTRELKHLGAHNLNRGRKQGLTGKQQLRQLVAAYDRQRNAKGLLPATYQAWFAQLNKPTAEARRYG